MSIESHRTDHDPRSYVARCGFFTQRPDVVEQYLWDLGLPTAAERVFWFHWREGMRAGDWCSSVPIKVVAIRCRLDVSTVTRAYQVLKAHQLVRRESAGRDPNNPFQQATSVTEVRLPSSLMAQLSRMPRRVSGRPVEKPVAPPPPETTAAPALKLANPVDRKRTQAIIRKLSGEDNRQFMASLNGRKTRMEFSPSCVLTPEERLVIQEALTHSANSPRPERASITPAPLPSNPATPTRRLTQLELARLQSKVQAVVAREDAPETIRQVAWSVMFGALRQHPFDLALNIAAKKLREACWSRPHRMPPNWTFVNAVPGLCGAA